MINPTVLDDYDTAISVALSDFHIYRKEENKVVPDRTRRLSHWEQTSTVNKYTQRTSMSGDISLAPVPVHQEFQW